MKIPPLHFGKLLQQRGRSGVEDHRLSALEGAVSHKVQGSGKGKTESGAVDQAGNLQSGMLFRLPEQLCGFLGGDGRR